MRPSIGKVRPMTTDSSTDAPGRVKRADARRNEAALLAAAGAVFVRSGVEAPIREIAGAAGVGVATIYRHFPSRAELIVAVYRHQVEKLAATAPELLAAEASAMVALTRWVDLFIDFLVTKHGLAAALRSGDPGFEALHAHFEERVVPACGLLLEAAERGGEARAGLAAYEFMHGIGNLCIGGGDDPGYDPRRLVAVLLQGLRVPA